MFLFSEIVVVVWNLKNPQFSNTAGNRLSSRCSVQFLRVRIVAERKWLSLAWSHVTTLETSPKVAQTVACVLFSPSPPPLFLLWAPSCSERCKEKMVFQTCFFLTELLLDSVSSWLTVIRLWVKRVGGKTIWWKAMHLCLGLNFGPFTWAIISPL